MKHPERSPGKAQAGDTEHQQSTATHRAQVKQSRSSKGKASKPKAQPKQKARSWPEMAKQN